MCLDPNILSPTLKIKIWLPKFPAPVLRVTERLCLIPEGEKLMEEMGFEETSSFGSGLYP
jgi:hypothetical protein